MVYLVILILVGVQFVIAYQHIDGAQMFARMFLIALTEAGLALMFFMHLWEEKRGLLLFVAIFYRLCCCGMAIWLARQLPHAGRSARGRAASLRSLECASQGCNGLVSCYWA